LTNQKTGIFSLADIRSGFDDIKDGSAKNIEYTVLNLQQPKIDQPESRNFLIG
jgi:hypothetical protein